MSFSEIPEAAWPKLNVNVWDCRSRRWAYRKHIETTPRGFVITEFLKPVK